MPGPETYTSVVIGDPQRLNGEALAALISTGPYTVVAQCQDCDDVLRYATEHRPTIVLLDLRLAKLVSFETVRKIRHMNFLTHVAILAEPSDKRLVLQCIRWGAQGFFVRSESAKQLFEGLKVLLDGEIYISPKADLEALFEPGKTDDPGDLISTLSPREYSVFEMLVEGKRPKDIAEHLNLSPKTVDTYRSTLMKKLDVHDIASLVKYSLERPVSK